LILERPPQPAEAPHVLLTDLGLPESPRWKDDRLFFSDVWAEEVVAVDLEGRRETVARVPGRPSGLSWLPDGRLAVVSMLDRTLLILDDSRTAQTVDLSGCATDLCNDMAIDGRGRAYIGDYRFPPGNDAFERHANASGMNLLLVDFSVDPWQPTVRIVADELLVPNGLVVTADGKMLIVAETSGHCLTAFTIDADGSLSDRRLWAKLDIAPDGICLGPGGAIWVASPFPPSGYQLVGQGGNVLGHIELTDSAAFACALGGRDGRSLFMLEAKFPTRPEERFGRIRVRDAPEAIPGR
jgi:sugar lactone lactonase YvrE